MRVFRVVLTHVRYKRSEIEQLQRTEQRRNDPENPQCWFCNPDTGNIKGDGSKQHLLPGHIFFQKMYIPVPEIRVPLVVIRVIGCTYVPVMLIVLWPEDIVGIKNEENGAEAAQKVIQSGI